MWKANYMNCTRGVNRHVLQMLQNILLANAAALLAVALLLLSTQPLLILLAAPLLVLYRCTI